MTDAHQGGGRADRQAADALVTALNAFALTTGTPEVLAAWSDPSALEGYTVGGIAGHVLGLMRRLSDVLNSKTPIGLSVIPYTDWYGGPPRQSAGSRAHNDRLIELGEAEAAAGPRAVAAGLKSTANDLRVALFRARADQLVPLASVPNAGVILNDFLRTRVVEIVVHADDIAVSVGLDHAELPMLAWDIAIAVLIEVAATRHSPLEVVRSLARPDRISTDGLSVF